MKKRPVIIVFVVSAIHGFFLFFWLNNQSSFLNSSTISSSVNDKYNCTLIRQRHYQHLNSPMIALASFPGAGNTWTRHLIEQVTGVFTGSVYYSGKKAMRQAFPGERYQDGRVSVIKTHKVRHWVYLNFTKAIVIHRNLKDAVLANFNRIMTGSKVRGANADVFSKKWGRFVHAVESKNYQTFYESWIIDFPGEILVLRYKDMMNNLYEQLVRIRNFLHSNATDNELKCAVLDEGLFHRKKNVSFNPWKSISNEKLKEIEIAEKYVENLINYKLQEN